jgi:hypothetical protein
MIVQVAFSRVDELPPTSPLLARREAFFGRADESMPFRAGDVFVVYVHARSKIGDWYFIDPIQSVGTPYPCPYHQDFFTVLDPTPSRFWESWDGETGIDGPGFVQSFPEWRRPGFYERLLDEKEPEQSEFVRRKRDMDREFPNPWWLKAATDFGFPWVQCPDCDEAWRTDRVAGIVDCPKCGKHWNNPHYSTRRSDNAVSPDSP